MDLTPVGGTVYFSADDGVHGRELWKSDGSAAGTSLVADLIPGPAGSSPSSLVNRNGTLHFVASNVDPSAVPSLYRSDGTAAGTVPVFTLPAGSSLIGSTLTLVGSTLYFSVSAYDATTLRISPELWKSDGTDAGTAKVADIGESQGTEVHSLSELADIAGTLYFIVSRTSTQGSSTYRSTQLWKSDGTDGGTAKVADLTPPSTSNGLPAPVPTGLTPWGDGLALVVPSPDGLGESLWKSDGTAAGTVAIRNFRYDGSISDLTVSGGLLFFTVSNTSGRAQVWKSDGTADGTVPLAAGVLGAGRIDAGALVDRGGTLYFLGTDPATQTPALWKSDGTTAGTAVVADLPLASGGLGFVGGLFSSGGSLYFAAAAPDAAGDRTLALWKSDGTAAGTVPLQGVVPWSAQAFVAAGGRFFFTSDGDLGNELGAASGLVPVATTNHAPVLSAVSDITLAPGSTAALTAKATEVDTGQTLTFSLGAGAPAGATIDPATGAFSWAVPAGQADGSYDITIVVTDDGDPTLRDSKTFTVVVSSVPALDLIASRTVLPGDTSSFTARATFPIPGHTLTFSLGAGAPAGATIDPVTGVFTWAVPAGQAPGYYDLTVILSDDSVPAKTASQTLTINVTGANSTPVLGPIADRTTDPRTTVAFTASATDIDDGQALTFSLGAGAPAGATIDATTGAFSWAIPAGLAPGIYTITVAVTDSRAAVATETFRVTVRGTVGGDLNGDGASDVAVYVPGQDLFALDFLDKSKPNGASLGQKVFNYGFHTGDAFSVPLVGDFNGDGTLDVGVYVPSQDLLALNYLDKTKPDGASLGQNVFRYGYHAGGVFSVPLVGDFNGDGVTDVGVYVPGEDLFALDYLDKTKPDGASLGQNVFHYGYHAGGVSSVPLVGDFNGDGTLDVGVYLPGEDRFALDYLDGTRPNGVSLGQNVFRYGYHAGGVMSVPLVGDFNGDGASDVGAYVPGEDLFALDYLDESRPNGVSLGQNVFRYGYHTGGVFSTPLVGDFNGDGTIDVGTYVPSQDLFALDYLDRTKPDGFSLGQDVFRYGYHTDQDVSTPIGASRQTPDPSARWATVSAASAPATSGGGPREVTHDRALAALVKERPARRLSARRLALGSAWRSRHEHP